MTSREQYNSFVSLWPPVVPCFTYIFCTALFFNTLSDSSDRYGEIILKITFNCTVAWLSKWSFVLRSVAEFGGASRDLALAVGFHQATGTAEPTSLRRFFLCRTQAVKCQVRQFLSSQEDRCRWSQVSVCPNMSAPTGLIHRLTQKNVELVTFQRVACFAMRQ